MISGFNMGEFIEPATEPKQSIFTNEFFESVVKKSIEDGDVVPDAKLIFIAGTDEKGIKFIAAVNLIDKDKFKLKVNGAFEHDWGGDNRVGAKVIASFR